VIITVAEILATVSDVLLMIWFVPKLNGVSLKTRPLSLIWAAVLLIFQLVADRFLQGFDLLYALIDFLIVAMFAFSLEKKKRLWQVFSAFLYVIVVMMFCTLVFALFSFALEDVSIIVQGNAAGGLPRILYLLICKLGHFALYGLLLQIFKKNRSLDWFSAILSFLFTLATAVGLGAVVKLTELGFQGLERISLVISVLLIAFNIILYLLIGQVQRLMRSKYELRLMQERLSFEKARIDEATYLWDNIRKVRHDLKNHFTVIGRALDDGNTETCRRYLSKLDQTVDHMGTLIQSGNPVIDYLINSKLSGLEGIRVLISGCVGNYSDIEEVDLACMLGNILDNAIEAVRKVKTADAEVVLRVEQQNSLLYICCENPYEGELIKQDGELKTTKKDAAKHGIGLSSVKHICKKYNGSLEVETADNIFRLSVLLNV